MDSYCTDPENLFQCIISCLPILADVSRADLLLYRLRGDDKVEVVAQARPHSILPLYAESLVGQEFLLKELPPYFAQASHWFPHPRLHADVLHGAPIMREVRAVRDLESGRAIGILSIETHMLAYERHRRRARAFQRALRQLQGTALRGELRGAENLSPFGEHDGIYFVDKQRRIQYVSGIAANFFRWQGHTGKLVGRPLDSLATVDSALVQQALSSQECLEREDEEQGLIWTRKVLPVRERCEWLPYPSARRLPFANLRNSYPVGAIVTIHDDTEARRQQRDAKVKLALMQEIHHRVKNNLQTIASLLRMQKRRVDSPELKAILQESIGRITSIAVVHEFLSQGGSSVISIKDVARRIISQMEESLLDPTKQIRIQLEGPSIYLPARQATACALVINELLQNAVEHGFQGRATGNITVALADEGEAVRIHIQDDGQGLPADFHPSETDSLGLRIVQSLVQDDLRGELVFTKLENGTRATIVFAKQLAEGEHI